MSATRQVGEPVSGRQQMANNEHSKDCSHIQGIRRRASYGWKACSGDRARPCEGEDGPESTWFATAGGNDMTNGVVCCLTLVKVQSTPTDRGTSSVNLPGTPSAWMPAGLC